MARKKKAKVGGKKKAASSAEAGGGASADEFENPVGATGGITGFPNHLAAGAHVFAQR